MFHVESSCSFFFGGSRLGHGAADVAQQGGDFSDVAICVLCFLLLSVLRELRDTGWNWRVVGQPFAGTT